ncbi:MAG: CHRD domain-containing protein [Planctomycetes bacterium]|nr:CHRD domain-containing protein [Planctomycetota bacterium]
MKNFLTLGSVAAIALAASAAQGAIISYAASLSGPAESPPNGSPGTGFATFDYDTTAHTLHMIVDFGGLVGTTTASHIHAATAVAGAGTAGVATTTPTFAGFPLGVTAGHYDVTLSMLSAASYNPSYVTAHGGTPASAEVDLMAAIASGKAYLNIHTTAFPGGEIRGFLFLVPAPGVAAVAGLCGLMTGRRRR